MRLASRHDPLLAEHIVLAASEERGPPPRLNSTLRQPTLEGLGDRLFPGQSSTLDASRFSGGMYKDIKTHSKLASPTARLGDPPRLVRITQR